MADTVWYAFVLGSIGIVLWYIRKQLKCPNLPPGPKGWLFVGNAFQQDPERPYLTWAKWSETFGDVFTVKNFGKPVVICNSFEAIYEMYVTKSSEFAGRPNMYAFDVTTDNRRNIFAGEFSPEWIRRKKIFLSNIKMYGDGLKHLEEIMVDIIDKLVDDIKQVEQKPLNLLQPFIFAIANTLALLILGKKYERSDKDFQTLLYILELDCKILGISLQSIAVEAIPFLCHLPLPFVNEVKKFERIFIHEWLPTLLEKKMDTYDRNDPACILDAYVKQHEDDMESGVQYPIEKSHLLQFIGDYFTAGVNTTRSTLYAMFAILTAEQNIQARVQEEIDSVIGDKHPKLKDREKMPYFQAATEEVLRYCCIVPTAIPHKAMTDSEICGHFIPNGTEVISNVWPMCHDEKVWGDPQNFRPERFLDDNDQLLPIDHPLRKRVMVFGAGRRKCPGENLARNRIFLIAASLLQKFVFKPAQENHPPVHDPRTYKFGINLLPLDYKVICYPRTSSEKEKHIMKC